MSDYKVEIDDADEAAAPEAPAAPEPVEVVSAAPGAGSILGAIDAEITQAVEDQDDGFKILPVGRLRRLYAKYKALDDDEVEDINRKAAARDRLRKRTGGRDVDTEGSNQRAALLLARACVGLLWLTDDGDKVDLADALASEGVEVLGGTLRYDRRLIPLFHLDDLASDASASDVAMRLHRWGKDNNYAPLRSTAQIVELHSSGLRGEALEAALAGN